LPECFGRRRGSADRPGCLDIFLRANTDHGAGEIERIPSDLLVEGKQKPWHKNVRKALGLTIPQSVPRAVQ